MLIQRAIGTLQSVRIECLQTPMQYAKFKNYEEYRYVYEREKEYIRQQHFLASCASCYL